MPFLSDPETTTVREPPLTRSLAPLLPRSLPSLPRRPMALLILLPAAAGAGIVASHLFTRAPLRGQARIAAALPAGRGQLPLLLARELLLNLIDGR